MTLDAPAIQRLRDALQWWPLGSLDTCVLFVGAVLMAQALNLAWERRDLIPRMSADERRLGCLALLAFIVALILWADRIGIPPVLTLGGLAARWVVRRAVALADAGQIGASWGDGQGDD